MNVINKDSHFLEWFTRLENVSQMSDGFRDIRQPLQGLDLCLVRDYVDLALHVFLS